MRVLKHLFENNQTWAAQIAEQDPEFFQRLSRQQSPEYLWIGCADSRVPANQIIGLLPGEVFVHRNVANLVIQTDLNCLSVIQYAVEILKVKHIIVCGHYGCGGVQAAMRNDELGLIDNWLRGIKDTYQKHRDELDVLPGFTEQSDRLCELNVIEQVYNVCHTTIVQKAWQNKLPLAVHGWIYGLKNGLLKDLDVVVTSAEETAQVYHSHR